MTTGATGYAPTVLIRPYNPEVAKYRKMWEIDDYRAVSPGEEWAAEFLKQANVPADATVIDFGCGTGRGGMMLALMGSMKVTLLDFTDNCLDPEVAEACVTQPQRIGFMRGDLTEVIQTTAIYGYCCDVMEHIPTDDVPKVLENVLMAAQHCFFAISTVDDEMGALIGEPLHLTVKPADWWAEQLRNAGAVIHWQSEQKHACMFYCTAWREARDVLTKGHINTDEETLNSQAHYNIMIGFQQAQPYDRQEREVIVLCGGPSLNDQESIDEIRRLRAEGAALVTLNAAYGWAIEHDLEPSMQIVVDARQFNSRFTKPVTATTKYMLASQCHPDTFRDLPFERTYIWHCGINEENEKLARSLNDGNFFPVPGGTTVANRAIPLLRMLGFYRMHFFGFDSCVRESGHHAYEQSENKDDWTVCVTCGGKVFHCTPWQLQQASEFRDLITMLGDEVELAVYGDGLIAQQIRYGAEISTEE